MQLSVRFCNAFSFAQQQTGKLICFATCKKMAERDADGEKEDQDQDQERVNNKSFAVAMEWRSQSGRNTTEFS